MAQKAISIPEPTNEVNALWSSVKALKEAVEMIQGIRGDREAALKVDVLEELDDLQEQIKAIDVSGGGTPTALSLGTITAITMGITSDGGADDVVLPEADTDDAGLLGADKWDEIVANTAKAANANHTGQVTGSGALALDVTAVTDQPASGVIVGSDTIIINDGGTLSEATMDQVATFTGGGGGATIRHIQVSGSGVAQALGTVITMDLSTTDVTTGAGDFTLAADVVTIINAATYEIHAQCTSVDIDTLGGARTSILIQVEINSGAVAGGITRFYHRETEENTGNVNLLYVASANDTVRVRLTRTGQNTTIETIPTGCKLLIKQIS